MALVAIPDQPGTTVAGEFIAGPPKARLLDEFDNRVTGVEITVSEQSESDHLQAVHLH
ncbi:hypothetical protein [Rhodohalobacter sp.]|uniref:hypothetical protein n=1 Tax=Rhodohalobacter sp. TaxID=1974210 RepID=UPI002ACD4EBF|nr:hypothetical protein [Rhodohalobacter sp.]MDZ7755141.1 hypothetical protein [Rhodohalobacter sp.]